MVQLATFLLLSICSFSYAAPTPEASSQSLSARANTATAKKTEASKEGPTVAEIITSKTKTGQTVTAAFQKAWNDSFTPTTAQETGGWIYADASKPYPALWIRRAPGGCSWPLKQLKPAKGVAASIDLRNPEKAPGGNPPSPNYHLVATFHTHPMGEAYGGNAANPSSADLKNAYERAVPGIVINRSGIIAYGPPYHEVMSGPQGFPSSQEQYSGAGQGKKVGTWKPANAPNQKE